MITDLKQKLRELRANRLINYGNTAYQHISNDWHFENVPTELRELWYGQDVVSFITLSIAYDSDIDQMSHNELVRWIDNERCLITRLEKVFSNLKPQKVGTAYGEN
ncbi:hypothetical protein ACMZ62_00015 [Streptococcus pluranimalium]|uniref:hypothetical protein n=1 Tax=Streptococcus thoraltensis TaxID=55085 RepID=UPI002A817D2B|nr:hypothetical protein [Streptococcus thoraltensis]MDY4761178.1 hypothetical protein [Streptococcus thoraltensis]